MAGVNKSHRWQLSVGIFFGERARFIGRQSGKKSVSMWAAYIIQEKIYSTRITFSPKFKGFLFLRIGEPKFPWISNNTYIDSPVSNCLNKIHKIFYVIVTVY